MQERLERRFDASGNHRWIEHLVKLVKNYNNTVHSTIKRAPNTVTIENEDEVYYASLKKNSKKTRKRPKFFVGDLVRLPIKKSKLSKGSHANWTSKIYKIVRVFPGKPYPVYSVADPKGKIQNQRYYERELNLVLSYKNRQKKKKSSSLL